jgi:aminomethyltransferase
MAGAAWAVGWDKPAFWGRDALTAERAAKQSRLMRGLVVTGRGIPRSHCAVTDSTGADVGEVTSGTFSPTRKQGVALALLDRSVTLGDEVVVDVRGRPVAATVSKPPFVEVGVREK